MSSADADRLFRPMFRCDNNTGKGSTDPYNCTVQDINSIHLFWYLVDDAVAYEVKWSTASYVTGGKEAWEETEQGVGGKKLAGDTIISDPNQYDLLIEHLNYQTDYRFAIRALHSLDKNDPKNSEWYGYGNGREWADYLGLQTEARYAVPEIASVNFSNTTTNSIRIDLNRKVDTSDADYDTYCDHFSQTKDANGNDVWKVDYLTVTASASTPDATVNPTYVNYKLTQEDWDRGYINVTGLSENSTYNIDVWDESQKVKVDACYNSMMKKTKGTPGAPITIKHIAVANDTLNKGTANEAIYDISKYDATMIDSIIYYYNRNTSLAENQHYYLEGGKAYYCRGSLSLFKGVTIETDPADIQAGKGKAILYMNGLSKTGTSPNVCNFMLGRQPEADENTSIALDIDSICFKNLDVQCPLAGNYGTSQEGTASSVGNYFMNMYSNGMGINVTLLEFNGCTFQGMIRGFFRIQGSNDFYINNINIKNCEFYNDGYYDLKSAGYQWIFGDHGSKPKSNIFKNVEICENVFYDAAHGSLLTDNNKNNKWAASVRWNINVHHNTFVNFQTESGNSPILNTRYIPGGSVLGFHDNLIIVTKDAADVNRPLGSYGWDARYIQGGDESGVCTFNIGNNWSTNDNLTNGQVFKGNAFNATSNAPGKTAWKTTCTYPYGLDELAVHADDISAVELMKSPNPKYYIGSSRKGTDHHTDNGIEGLYYNQTAKVLSSQIYLSGAGAAKLRTGSSSAKRTRRFF